MWEITRYDPSQRKDWDAFAAASRNATFLFQRGYMDYHSDRFSDHSLMARKNGKLRAVLPANLTADGVLHSHQGLTYGGWVLPPVHFDAADMLGMWDCWIGYCRREGIKMIDYKPLPWIYASQPSQEDLYALFRHGAELISTDISSTVSLRDNPGFNTMRRRQLRKAAAIDAMAGECHDVAQFMSLVEDCLKERHDARPVHTAAEMELLTGRFPDNIRMFVVFNGHDIDAGVMVYESATTAHCQYIATSPRGRELNLLTSLFDYLITDVYKDKRYFDFGISNEDGGRFLNENLLRQKASMGATGVAYSRYRITVG